MEVLYSAHSKEVDRQTKKVLKEEDMPDAYKLTYTFDDQEIQVHAEGKPNISMGFEIDDACQVAENLNDGRKMGLPPLSTDRVGVLQSMRLTYLDGTEMLFHWQGPGNHLNVNENGGIEAGRPRAAS